MKTDERRRDDIRDEMLIDMARGIQTLLAKVGGFSPHFIRDEVTIIGRLESHIEFLKGAK